MYSKGPQLRRTFAWTLVWTIVVALPCAAQAGKRQKKLSLAELAALEWKLEQASAALVSKTNAGDRLKALDELAKIDDPRVIPPLAEALNEDPDAKVRKAAATALAAHKTPEVKGVLMLASAGDPDAGVRGAASKSLTRFNRRMQPAKLQLPQRKVPAPKTVKAEHIKQAFAMPSGAARAWAAAQAATISFGEREALIKTHLVSDPSARVREACAVSLVAIAGKGALPVLIKAVSDGDPIVRFALVRLIARFDDPGALLVLERVAKGDSDNEVRLEAREMLEPSTPVGRRLLKQRIAKLASANPADRIAAITGLATFTDWRAMVPMSCALLSDRSVHVRTAAAKSLADMHDASVLTALRVAAVIEPDAAQKNRVRGLLQSLRRRVDNLVKQLSDKDLSTRVRAARALGQAAYPPGLPALVAAAKDKEAKIRRVAIEGLRNFNKKEAQDALKAALADSDAEVRRIANEYFQQQERLAKWSGFFRDANRLVMKTTAKDPHWRADAAIGLGIAGAERMVDSLTNLLLRDPDENVRLAAAWALVLMSSTAAENALKKAAGKDKSQRVRLTARKYLVIDKVSVSDLIEQLAAEKPGIREDAAEALALRASGNVLHHLIRTSMCDQVPQVRAAALRGLGRVGNPLAKTVIRIARARDKDQAVKRVATMMYFLTGGK